MINRKENEKESNEGDVIMEQWTTGYQLRVYLEWHLSLIKTLELQAILIGFVINTR